MKMKGEKKTLYLLDCEGFENTTESINSDVNLFLITLLLSSCLIYNGHSSINNKAIKDLSYLLYIFIRLFLCFPINIQCLMN